MYFIKLIDFSCLLFHSLCDSFSDFLFLFWIVIEPKPVIELYDFLVESELQQYYNAIK